MARSQQDPRWIRPWFYAYTYAPRAVYLDPILWFMRELCNLGRASGLPMYLRWGVPLRDRPLTERSWVQFEKGVRSGDISHCGVVQCPAHGMKQAAFVPGAAGRLIPFALHAELVPDGGISPDSQDGVFALAARWRIQRYPTNVVLQIDLNAHVAPGGAGIQEYLHELESTLVTRIDTAYAHVVRADDRRRGFTTTAIGLTKPLAEELATSIPCVPWAAFLGPGHIERLGGKERLRRELSGCRVEELSTETGQRLYIQLTDDIRTFDETVAKRYRPLLAPLITCPGAGGFEKPPLPPASRLTYPRFCVYTYAPPAVYVEPILSFVRRVCELGKPSGLPISLNWNWTPRETFLSEDAWKRFERRVRNGKILTCLVTQYPFPGMTRDSFPLADRIFPFFMSLELVPDGGILPDTQILPFRTVVRKGTRRYPTTVMLEIDLHAHASPGPESTQEYVHKLERELVEGLHAASACIARSELFGGSPLPFTPSVLSSQALIEHLDSGLPCVPWGAFLGPKHIAGLGGKARILRELAGCRVDDLSSETEDRLYVQLTETVGEFDESVDEKYRPFFEPLLPEE